MLGPLDEGLKDSLLVRHVEVVTGQQLAHFITGQHQEFCIVDHLHKHLLSHTYRSTSGTLCCGSTPQTLPVTHTLHCGSPVTHITSHTHSALWITSTNIISHTHCGVDHLHKHHQSHTPCTVDHLSHTHSALWITCHTHHQSHTPCTVDNLSHTLCIVGHLHKHHLSHTLCIVDHLSHTLCIVDHLSHTSTESTTSFQ